MLTGSMKNLITALVAPQIKIIAVVRSKNIMHNSNMMPRKRG